MVIILDDENINLYLYQGKDMFNVERNLEDNEGKAIKNKEYFVDYENGMVLLAIPEENKETSLKFTY
jgi:hypothetical protein